MHSPFLWRIAKGQSRLIIKKRQWRTSRTRQISTQRLKLSEHIHQNLSLSRLNGHDSLQHTPQKEASLEEEVGGGSTAAVGLTYFLVVGSPEEGGGGGGAPEEDSTLRCLELALI